MSSRVLTSDEARGATRWQGPAVTDPAERPTAPRAGAPVTLEQLEALQRQAWDEAWALGHEQGVAAGLDEARALAGRLASVMDALAQPLDELDASVEEQVVHLSMMVVRHLLRRELKTDPAHVIGVVREALSALPVSSRDVRLYLHPDDAELVRTTLADAEGERAWRIVEDPVLARGGCRVETETSRIDARVESRLAAMLSAIAGDERRRDDARS